MKIRVEVYDGCKYIPETHKKEAVKVEYENVKEIKVKVIEDAEIFAQGFDEVDEYKEYCILTFDDGETATFRNSHVDVFKIA